MKKNNFKSFHENKKRKSHNQKIHDAHVLRKQEKEEAKQTKEAHQQAINTAMARYKANKQSRLKKLVKKTRRGQPVMQGQIDLLLHKIQQQKQKENK
ncbi:unnamed protein product [Rotaria sordida]|uniref:Thyroid transcription factor 1-associated protein 26 n=1 Tax=Rotaria sordida TaxID=392033 RepID=A0A819B609_9BILA|nr:unnamed protein product [Rotaria sordida]CAF3793087.1 unnamed protein product [Rotaria sordida]